MRSQQKRIRNGRSVGACPANHEFRLFALFCNFPLKPAAGHRRRGRHFKRAGDPAQHGVIARCRRQFDEPGSTRAIDLGCPNICVLPLACGNQDGERPEPRFDHALLPKNIAQRKNPLRHPRALEDHAVKSTHASKNLQHAVYECVLLGRNAGFAGYGCNSWHGGVIHSLVASWIRRSTHRRSRQVL